MVSYIVGSGSGKISDRVVLAEDANVRDYDPNYYIEKQIMGALQKIFEVFGHSEDAVKSGQTTLGGFGGA